ncbi:phosphatidylcholine:ceramide cholinephosphotransferase 1-like isoform X2 [Artemia franciscana]
MVTQTDVFMMGDNVSHTENVQDTENINLSSIEDVDKTMVNEGRERLLSAIYGSFEARIPLEGEVVEYMEDTNSPTVSDLYQRSGMCSPRLDEAWSSDREDTRSIRSGRGHSKKLSTTSNISVDSGVAYDEGIVQITIPAPSRDEPKFPPEPTKTIISFMFCFSSWVLTTVTLALVHERVPDRLNTSRLPDTFLDNVPESPWALDVSEVILVFSGLSCAVLVCFHKYRLILIRRIFFLLGVLYLFRCLTMYVTVLPVASKTYYCSPKVGDTRLWDVVLRAVRLLIGMGLSVNGLHTYCGDYIYSGHTVILTMACLIFQE